MSSRVGPITLGVSIMLKKDSINALKRAIEFLKIDALECGRYEDGFSSWHYDNRDKSKAFRCMGYNERVRQISGCEDILKYLTRDK